MEKLSNFNFQQIFDINKKNSAVSNSEDLHYHLIRHFLTSSFTIDVGLSINAIKSILDNSINNEEHLQYLIDSLVTKNILILKNKKYFLTSI